MTLWNKEEGLYAFLDRLGKSKTDLITVSKKGEILHAETIEAKPFDELVRYLIEERGFKRLK